MSTGAVMLLEWGIAFLLVLGGLLALAAAAGVVRGRDFFDRLQLSGMAYTGATWCVCLASVLYFSWSSGSLALRPVILAALLGLTAPIPTALLARAALFRLRQARTPNIPPPLRSPHVVVESKDGDQDAAGADKQTAG